MLVSQAVFCTRAPMTSSYVQGLGFGVYRFFGGLQVRDSGLEVLVLRKWGLGIWGVALGEGSGLNGYGLCNGKGRQ